MRSDAAHNSSAVESADFTVSLDGVIYPRRRSQDATRFRVPEDPLAPLVLQEVWSSLPFFAKQGAGFESVDDAVEAYAASLQRLQRRWDETQQLLAAISRMNSASPGEDASKTPDRDREQGEESSGANGPEPFPWEPSPSPLESDLWAEPLDEAQIVLREALWAASRSLAVQVLESLDEAVSQQCLGLVRWTGPTTYEIHYFREIVIERHNGADTIVASEQREIIHDSELRRIRKTSQGIGEPGQGEPERRLARYELHMLHAVVGDLERAASLIPHRYRPLVRAVPPWLRTLGTVVDGRRFRQRVISRAALDNIHQLSSTRLEVNEPASRRNPVIVLANRYVLVGWGPDEIEAESQWQRELDGEDSAEEEYQGTGRRVSAATAGQFRRWIAIAGLVGFFAVVFAAVGAVRWPMCQLVGWVLAVLTLVPVDEAVRLGATMRGREARGSHRFWSAGSAILLVLGLQWLATGAVQDSSTAMFLGLAHWLLMVPLVRWAWSSR